MFDWTMRRCRRRGEIHSQGRSGGNIERAQYSLDGGKWILVARLRSIIAMRRKSVTKFSLNFTWNGPALPNVSTRLPCAPTTASKTSAAQKQPLAVPVGQP